MIEVGLFSDGSGEQSCVTAYDLSTGVALKNFKHGSCGRNGLALINDEYLLAVQNGKQLIHVYDVEKDTCSKKIVCSERITAIATSPDGLFVAVALLDKIYMWEFSSGNLYCVLSRHYQDIVGIKFTSDGKFFISFGGDNLVIVWDLNRVLQTCMTSQTSTEPTDKPVYVLSNHSMSVQDVYVGVCGIRGNMVTCSLDQTCKVFEISSGTLLKNFVFDVACMSVAMDVTEKFLFVGLADGRICFINCYEQKSNNTDSMVEQSSYVPAHKKSVTRLAVTSDGLNLISGSKDCLVKIWHISSRKCIRTFEFKDEITNVQLHPSFIFASTNKPNNNKNVKKCKRAIGNFQRTVYVPSVGTNVKDMCSLENEKDTIPFVLKDIDRISKEDVSPRSCVNDVLNEFYYSKTNESSTEQTSRQELVQNISALEAMTQDLYKATTDKLLKHLHHGKSSG